MRNSVSLFICFLFFFSCSDNVDLKESDLKKYPWIASFLESAADSFEGTHNIDIGTIQFSYIVSKSKKDSLLSELDNIAQSESWKLVSSSALGREYSKVLKEYPDDSGQTIIKIEIDTIENRIRFNIK